MTAAASAAGLSVKVLDSHHDPIPGATVSLVSRGGERQARTADQSGGCEFANAVAGEYLVLAEAAGFDASAPQAVQLPANNAVTITLGVAQIRSTVVVTASGTPQTTDEVAKALTVVDGGTIALRQDPSVADALLDIPGLYVEQLGGPLSTVYFKTRGLRSTDTAVLVDGMRLRDAAGTQADASGMLQDLTIADTGRIEVLRGAGSSLYGTDAIGGVVNIVTDEGGGRTRGSVTLDGGSLGAARASGQISGGTRNDRIQYSAGLTHWNVTRGVDGDSPARNTSGHGQVTYRISPIAWLTARVYAGGSFGFIRQSPIGIGNLPSSGTVNAVPLPLAQQHLYEAGTPVSSLATGNATFIADAFDSDSTRTGKYFTGALRFVVRPSDRLGLTAQYQNVRSTRNYGDGPAGPGYYQPSGSNLSGYLGRIQTANARVDYSPVRSHQLDAGYEFEDEDFRNVLTPPAGNPAFYSDVSQRSHTVYAQDQVRLDGGRLQFAAGYRAQFFSLEAPHFQPAAGAPFAGYRFAAPPTAQTGDLSAAYTFRSTGTKLRAHAGRGYRAPSLFERFGSYFDAYGYSLYGDPRLKPDRSNSIDAGIEQRLWNSRAQISATYFYTRLNEVIIFDFSGAINPATDPLGRYGGYRNTGGGLARGVELAAGVAAGHGLQINAAYTYTDARGETPVFPGVWQMFDSPRHRYSFFATQRVTSRVTAMFRYIGTGEYIASIYPGAFRFPGASRAQAMLSYRRPLGEGRALRFYGKADNLFNQTYFQSGFRMPGVTGTAGTQFEF
jgi:iron complex outermembrane receptor protein